MATLAAAVAVVGGRPKRPRRRRSRARRRGLPQPTRAGSSARCAPTTTSGGTRSSTRRTGRATRPPRRLLPPLLFARASGKRPLTESGVYYLPFGQPLGARGAGSVALHVADGSQVIAERVGGRRLTILVGKQGRERYGSCLARLGQARLADGYLPIMTTSYTDAGPRSLPPGVVRGAYVGDGLARQLHPARRGREQGVGQGRPASAEPVARRTTEARQLARAPRFDLPRLQPAVEPSSARRSRTGSGAARSGRCISPGSTTRGDEGSSVDAARYESARRAVRGLLERTPDRGHADRRPGAARERRVPQPPDPEPAADLALQHRQPVRAVLVPGGRRRRAGDGASWGTPASRARSCARR